MVSIRAITAAAVVAVASVAAEESKDLYHVRVPKPVFEMVYKNHGSELDIWETRVEGDFVEVDVYGTAATVQKFQGVDSLLESSTAEAVIESAPVSMRSQIESEQTDIQACQRQTDGYLKKLSAPYADNGFFDCWRTAEQVFEFIDALVAKNPKYITKIEGVTKTAEGRSVPAYKISTGSSAKKKALYAQGLIHAREWSSGASVHYALAAFLDGINSNDASVMQIFEEYDWYIVPILNIDGFKYTWTKDRMWRKNRRAFTKNGRTYYGVDLNRNFGPKEFFDKDGKSRNPNDEAYPGDKVLSEPESAGIFNFIKSIKGLAGTIDVHMYAQSVLRPFSNQGNEAPEPYGSKMKALGDAVRDAIQEGSSVQYDSAPSFSGIYYSYGTFKDSMFLEMGNIASFTLELEGDSFVTEQSAIKDVGSRLFNSFKRFSTEMKNYLA
ncbi:TPA: hypothetical protein N0F65_001374 [Lagenidium giganteum]|uniref:Peptidase M14 domain-containing protein n=1 Tax=Lagenidium giganteum TaxID=4803 RepID=A0AAV2YY33_9STRA|nr:TPA: hypothetical protein N0F65_001374 [Lagenidium giganteum]